MRYRDNLENYICRTVTENPSYMQVKFKVPTNVEITAGEIFVPNELDNSIEGNWDVFIPDTFENNTDIPAIVLNNGFETTKDGRRPEGQPDYTQYVYRAGQTITAHLLLEGVKFELSPDNISNEDEMIEAIANGIEGSYLYPVAGSSSLTWTANLSDIQTKTYLIIEGVKWFRLGGLFGADFAQTLIVRVKDYNANSGSDTLSIDAELGYSTDRLRVGSQYVGANSVLLRMELSGYTDENEQYTWELTDYNGDSGDNSLFELSYDTTTYNSRGNKNGLHPLSALTEAKTYRVYVKVTGASGDSTIEGFDIPIGEAVAMSALTYSLGSAYSYGSGDLSYPVSANTVLLRLFNVTGGYYPYTITLTASSDSNDNASFVVVNQNNYEEDTTWEMNYTTNMVHLENTVALTEDKTYVIQFSITDNNGNTATATLNLTKDHSTLTGTIAVDE